MATPGPEQIQAWLNDPEMRTVLEGVLNRVCERLCQSVERSMLDMMREERGSRRQWTGPGKPTYWNIKWTTIGKQYHWKKDYPIVPMASLSFDGCRSSRRQSFPWPYAFDGDWNIEYEMTIDILRDYEKRQEESGANDYETIY